MTKIKDITNLLESIAPKIYQESYDNSGLLVGDQNTEISKVLVSLDCTEAVVDEAIAKGCNLIVSHHPIVFKGLKKFTGSNYVERTVVKAIKNDVALYAIHTNLDHALGGVNYKIAQKLGLGNVKMLSPKKQSLKKLTTFVPASHLELLCEALHKAGAGQIGKYDECSFRIEGTGTFIPSQSATPFSGTKGQKSYEKETRVEFVLPIDKEHAVMAALRAAHPYEEIAYYLQSLDNDNQDLGAGAVGYLPEPLDKMAFLNHLKASMGLTNIRYTQTFKDKIHKVALCGGSGSFLLKDALAINADAFVTADFKYHEFFDAEERLMIADVGHYESEIYTKDLIFEEITKKFLNIAVILSEINTNPINYF